MAGEPPVAHSAPPALLVLPPIQGWDNHDNARGTKKSLGGGNERHDKKGWRGRDGGGGRGEHKDKDRNQWWATDALKRQNPYISNRQAINNYTKSPSYSTPSHYHHHLLPLQHHTQPPVPIHRRSFSLYGFSASKKPAFRVHKGFMANSLFFAVQTCRFNRVKVLLDQGLKPRVKDGTGRNLLMACLEVEDADKREKMFSYLLRRGTDPHYVDPFKGQDVLTWAVCMGRAAQVSQTFFCIESKDNIYICNWVAFILKKLGWVLWTPIAYQKAHRVLSPNDIPSNITPNIPELALKDNRKLNVSRIICVC